MKITLSNKKASASIICRDLIADGRNIIYLAAYGPTQEVRAFAQILGMTTQWPGQLEHDGGSFNAWCNNPLRIIPKMGEGYSGVYITPANPMAYLIADSTEVCHHVFARILDQQEFVHRDWYETLFPEVTTEIKPLIGEKFCWEFRNKELKQEVVNRLKYGGLKMPPPTANFTITTADKAS